MKLVIAALCLITASAAAEGPCDITGKAGNPCVAAHSTTSALYAAYDGPLYNVTRASDGKSADIGVLSAGGFADISAHDAFCSQLDCVISNVYDQSPNGNQGADSPTAEGSTAAVSMVNDINTSMRRYPLTSSARSPEKNANS